MRRPWPIGLAALALGGCLPRSFDALEAAAPVTTIVARFPDDPEAIVRWALTVDPDDEGRGRVLFSDGDRQLGWLRLDELGGHEIATLLDFEREALTDATDAEFTGLAAVPGRDIPEGLLRIAGDASLPDRIVRFRVADFSRVDPVPMSVPPWVIDEFPLSGALVGPIAAVDLDAGQPEVVSASEDGSLVIWPELGTTRAAIAETRETLLAEDPTVFDADPAAGFGVTRCAGLGGPSGAIAGGRLLAGDRTAAVVLLDDGLHFVAAVAPEQLSLVGTPLLDCVARTILLAEPAQTLVAGDLDADGDDDLLVGAPASERVWVFLGDGDLGLPGAPSFAIEPDEPREGGFGSSMSAADLGGDVGRVLIVGAPTTSVAGSVRVGRIHVFDLDGTSLTEFSDLEPVTDSQHGLGVHALGLPARDELVVSGRRELRVHWVIEDGDPRP